MKAAKLRTLALLVAVPVAVPVIWWFTSADSENPYFPALSRILSALVDTWIVSRFLSDIVPSLARMFAGYAIAAVLGIGLGLLLGRIAVLRHAFNPVVQFIRSIPATALIPVFMILFGIGDMMKIALIATVCTFPILLNTIDGVRSVDATLVDVGRCYRLTAMQRMRFLLLPSAALPIFTGLRIAMSVAFIIMIVSEMIGATNGIGYGTLIAQRNFRFPVMWAGMLLMGILGWALNSGFLALERTILHAHIKAQQNHQEAGAK
jgi:ABC-type nitrate/sulfonate/bicarbonate transport system permease component